MLRAVIFDLDGTFYDNSCLRWLLPLTELFRLRYLWRERTLRKRLRGVPHDTEDGFYQHFFRAISHRHPDRVAAWYYGHYLPLQVGIIHRHCKLDAWVKPRIEELHRQDVKVVVYSDYGCVRQKLQALGLDPRQFDLIVDAPQLGGLKPCVQSTRRLLTMLDARPDEVVFVGDRVETDINAARAVGAPYQLVRRKGKEVIFTTDIPQ